MHPLLAALGFAAASSHTVPYYGLRIPKGRTPNRYAFDKRNSRVPHTDHDFEMLNKALAKRERKALIRSNLHFLAARQAAYSALPR